MTITARFASTCPLCRLPINVGDKVEWTKGAPARHLECPNWEATTEFESDPRSPSTLRPVQDADDRAYVAWLNHQAARPIAPRLTVEDAGVYVLPDGGIVKMQANKDKTAVYPKLWREIPSIERINENDARVRGEYLYLEDWQERKELLARVQAEGHKMTLDEAKAFILRYGICARCGRGLKDATSVERGIGPVCITYFSEGATGAQALVGAAAEQPRTYEEVFADDDEDPQPVPARTPYQARSRWSRPGDDELEHAAY